MDSVYTRSKMQRVFAFLNDLFDDKLNSVELVESLPTASEETENKLYAVLNTAIYKHETGGAAIQEYAFDYSKGGTFKIAFWNRQNGDIWVAPPIGVCDDEKTVTDPQVGDTLNITSENGQAGQGTLTFTETGVKITADYYSHTSIWSIVKVGSDYARMYMTLPINGVYTWIKINPDVESIIADIDAINEELNTNVVHRTGAETINGTKTFNKINLVKTQSGLGGTLTLPDNYDSFEAKFINAENRISESGINLNDEQVIGNYLIRASYTTNAPENFLNMNQYGLLEVLKIGDNKNDTAIRQQLSWFDNEPYCYIRYKYNYSSTEERWTDWTRTDIGGVLTETDQRYIKKSTDAVQSISTFLANTSNFSSGDSKENILIYPSGIEKTGSDTIPFFITIGDNSSMPSFQIGRYRHVSFGTNNNNIAMVIVPESDNSAGGDGQVKINGTLTVNGIPFRATFEGTKAQWNALSSTDKAKYDIVILTDD